MDHSNDIAALKGIPSESTAILDILINKVNTEEESYQQRIEPVKPNDLEKPDKPASAIPKLPKTVAVPVRSLTNNKTFTIRSEADIDAFVEEMRQELGR